MRRAVCLICRKPNDIWLNFLKEFTNYDVYIVIDDNTTIYTSDVENIRFVQIENKDCEESGFCDVNYSINRRAIKPISGWDKALYYFAVRSKIYKDIWIIEDDVFFANENTLISVDNQYPIADLLINKINPRTEDPNWSHWRVIDDKITKPHYNAMCCAIRLSNSLLEKIEEYATANNRLFFLEGLIPTLCKQNNLILYSPIELSDIYWKHNFLLEDFSKTHLYHPVKEIESHLTIRNQFLPCFLPLQGVLIE